MEIDGSNYEWCSHQLQTASGYDVAVFNLTADEQGNALKDSKGPILLLHGMFSSPVEWLSRNTPDTPSLPIQLAQAGYDVWIGASRGRPYTDTH